MILHTIVPMEYLMETPVLPQTQMVNHKSGIIEVVNSSEGQRIQRIISTDPKVYLDKNLEIGSYLK